MRRGAPAQVAEQRTALHLVALVRAGVKIENGVPMERQGVTACWCVARTSILLIARRQPLWRHSSDNRCPGLQPGHARSPVHARTGCPGFVRVVGLADDGVPVALDPGRRRTRRHRLGMGPSPSRATRRVPGTPRSRLLDRCGWCSNSPSSSVPWLHCTRLTCGAPRSGAWRFWSSSTSPRTTGSGGSSPTERGLSVRRPVMWMPDRPRHAFTAR